jgi:cytochrome c oxidase assembly protein subunit 15
MSAASVSQYRPVLHWWAVCTACLTFVLLFVGGLVTSHGAGLTVPDWPNSFGYNMFTFPVSRWVGGIFYEHTHRLIGTFVGLFTALLAGGLWVTESKKEDRWAGIAVVVGVVVLLGFRVMPVYLTLATLAPIAVVVCAFLYRGDGGRLRWLGMAALAAVVLQGVLGGVRVVWLKDEIGIFHGMLAQAFFVFITLLAIMTSRRFTENRWADYEPDPTLRWWAAGCTALIFLQLGLGATMRHEHIGLSIPDFPLAYGRLLPDTSAEAMEKINAARVAEGLMQTNALHVWIQMAHRFVAVLIGVAVIAFAVRARRSVRAVRGWSLGWVVMILCQIALGAWTIWSNKAADVATLHMALGALSLLLGGVLTFRLFCGARSRDFVLPDAPNPRSMEHAA